MVCLSLNALSDPFAFFFFFSSWGTTPAVLGLFIFFFLYFPFFFVRKNKTIEWIWTFHFFVFSFVDFWFCIVAQIVFCVWTFWTITGAFLTLADLYFCCKCCKTVDKTVYNLLRQPFFGRLQCRARFCKGFAVLTFLIHACCSYNLNNKTCCWRMVVFYTSRSGTDAHIYQAQVLLLQAGNIRNYRLNFSSKIKQLKMLKTWSNNHAVSSLKSWVEKNECNVMV